MSATGTIDTLRAELAKLSGPARLGALTRLGQALAERYWRTGPGNAAGLPDLDATIEAFTEAHGYLAAHDGIRGQVAGLLGMLLGARHTGHTGTEQDRETGIALLEEALTFPGLPAMLRKFDLLALAQFYLSPAAVILQSPTEAMSLMTKGATSDDHANVDRAVDHIREVLEDPASEEVTEVAESLLAVAETMQTLLRGPGGGLHLQRLMDAMAKLQKLKDRFTRGSTPGHGSRPAGTFLSFDDFQAISTQHPDAVVEQAEAPEPAVEQAALRRPAAAPVPHDQDQLRRLLRAKLSIPGSDDPTWVAAAALLLPDAPLLPVELVDDLVALATLVVDMETDTDAGTVAEDWFILAVALYLRDRLDEHGDHTDRVAGAESLLSAVTKVPLDHPAATTMLRALGAFLDENKPLDGVLEAVAGGFADRLDAAITAGVATDTTDLATLHALRCLCLAATS